MELLGGTRTCRLIGLIFLSAIGFSAALRGSLFDDNDIVEVLTKENFEETIYGSKYLWLVEFYSAYCGHCVRFAPIWKELAQSVQGWNSIVRVAAINCPDGQNMDVCRKYDIHSFPTLKYFRPNMMNTSAMGELYDRGPGKSMEAIRHGIASHVEKYKTKYSLTQWPELAPAKSSEILSFYERDNINNVKHLAVFIEKDDSVVGRQLILDMHNYNGIVVRRAVESQGFFNLKLKINEYPQLYLMYRNRTFHHLAGANTGHTSLEQFVDVLTSKLTLNLKTGHLSPNSGRDKLVIQGEARMLPNSPADGDKNSNILGRAWLPHQMASLDDETGLDYAVDYDESSVYMLDLESAINFMLRYEVPLEETINKERLLALDRFIKVLVKYFPGRAPVMSFLLSISQWLPSAIEEQGELHSDDWLDLLKTNTEGELADRLDWYGCQGSGPMYRGYPCGAWTLFHVLSINAAQRNSTHGSVEVVGSMIDYITTFFSCLECRSNFEKMLSHVAFTETTSNNAILWLWERHNNVNERLTGDLTDDPKHPKIQYPPETLCENCRSPEDDATWDRENVLIFLKKHYDSSNIVDDGVIIGNGRNIKNQETAVQDGGDGKANHETSIDDYRDDGVDGYEGNSEEDGEEDNVINHQQVIEDESFHQRINAQVDLDHYDDDDALTLEEMDAIQLIRKQNKLNFEKSKASSGWIFNGYDISLLVILYVASAAIVLVLYTTFMIRRRRRRRSYSPHFA